MTATETESSSSWTGSWFGFANCECLTGEDEDTEPSSILSSVLQAPGQLAAAALDNTKNLAAAAQTAVTGPPPRPPLHRQQSTATAMLDEAFTMLADGDPPRVPAAELGELLYLVTRHAYEPGRVAHVALALDADYIKAGLDEAACARLVAHFQEFL